MELNQLQNRVAKHYEGGEFAGTESMTNAKELGDTLFVFCLNEADDAESTEVYQERLETAINQLRSLQAEIAS